MIFKTDPDGTELRASSQVRRLSPTILRIAGWPIETLDSLRSEQLVKQIDDWLSNDDLIRQESEVLAWELHRAIPRLGDRKVRRVALELKRLLRGSTQSLPEHLAKRLLENDIVRQEIRSALLIAMRRRKDHATERANIELAHEAELVRASSALDSIASECRFLRALCLASPSAFQQWQNARGASQSRRNRQRLQNMLHRYLMRAIGRATPNGLWAGIALEDMTTEAPFPLQVASAAPINRVSPDLSVWIRGLENLTRRRPWAEGLLWRRNPTLHRINGCVWEFGTFANGSWCARRIAHHAPLEALIDGFSLTDRLLFQEIVAALCHKIPNMGRDVARELVEAWIDAGLLWSTTALPPFYSNTWEALDAIIETLPAAEKPIWRDCRLVLKQIAKTIETRIDLLEPELLRGLLDDAKVAVTKVLCRYDAAVPNGRDVLVLDRTAPFRFSVSPVLAHAIEKRLRDYWKFDRYGLGEIESQIAIYHLFGGIDDNKPVPLRDFLIRGTELPSAQQNQSWQDRVLSQATGENLSKAQEAFLRWEREIEPSFDMRVHCLKSKDFSPPAASLPPGAALLLLDISDQGAALRIGGVTPETCFFYSRFSHLFCNDDHELDDFLRWQRAAIAETISRWPQLEFVDLAVRNHVHPNVVARPQIASQLIDPLDPSSSTSSESDVLLQPRWSSHSLSRGVD